MQPNAYWESFDVGKDLFLIENNYCGLEQISDNQQKYTSVFKVTFNYPPFDFSKISRKLLELCAARERSLF